jgi:hypothetical protein
MNYVVSYSWYEEYSPIIVSGPEQKNWTEYCDSLLPEAIELALKDNNEVVYNKEKDKFEIFRRWIGWSDIVDSLVKVLETKGYTKVKLEEANYWGSNIIRDAHGRFEDEDHKVDLSQVIKHNLTTEYEMDKEHYFGRLKDEENTAEEKEDIQKQLDELDNEYFERLLYLDNELNKWIPATVVALKDNLVGYVCDNDDKEPVFYTPAEVIRKKIEIGTKIEVCDIGIRLRKLENE